MKKLYITSPKDNGEGVYNLIADDGEHLASHFCSHSGYALGDLESGRPERQKEWKERFGEYQVVFLGDDEMTNEELLKRNKEWYDKSQENKDKQKENQPSIVLEISE